MKSPIFKQVTEECLKEANSMAGGLSGISLQTEIELIQRRMTMICLENKEALLQAWTAETGILPSKSVICNQWKDGVFKMWVETKEESDARERA